MWWQRNLIFVFGILCILKYAFGESSDPLVDTNIGQIRGLWAEDGSYSMFMGIPYAHVDANNPFGASMPYPKFEDTFEAYDDTIICPQMVGSVPSGSLNCLNINVFVPNTTNTQYKVPVMIYIYGGGFTVGSSGRYLQGGPKYLVRHDVILVTFNYRLGPYGFMCLDIPEVSGNQGLKDQVLALNWVKDNIEAFGGDPHKITVFGLSAGAHSVDFHLTYGDENLFQNAILESGSTVASTVFVGPDKSAPQKIAGNLGFTTDSVIVALYFLANTNPLLVINAVQQLNMHFKPCVEEKFDDVEQFITETWINVRKPKVTGKPVMIGFCEFERYSSFDVPEKYINRNVFRENLQLTFDFDHEKLNEMEELVRHFYLGGENITEEVKWALVNFDSDFTYVHPVQRSINKYLEMSASHIFQYMFSYVGNRNFGHVVSNITVDAAIHSDEIGYLFDAGIFQTIELTSDDERMIDRMTTMWTNFAKYGDPTPETSELLPIKWRPLSRTEYYYLKIDSDLKLESRPFYNRMAFWDLFYILNENSQKFVHLQNGASFINGSVITIFWISMFNICKIFLFV